jgi:hypothetical protein
MKSASSCSVAPLLSFVVALALSLNPACSESTGPGRGIDVPGKIFIDCYAVWSGTHDQIAYIHYQKPESDDLDSSGVYTVRPDGTDKKLLYRGDSVSGLDWTVSGERLITNYGNALVIISFPRGEADTITLGGQYFLPVWSVDGDRIAFAKHWGDSRGIYVMSVDGTNTRLVIPYGHNVDWAYSDSLLYLNFDNVLPIGAICMADTTGNFKRVVYQPADNIIASTPKAKMHSGTGRIVITAQENGGSKSVWTLEPNEMQAVKVRSSALDPDFSPDGNKIVFTNIHGDLGRLWIMNWDGSGLFQLTY